ncbi:MAG: efflux RND transporter periplasmic adaptor subunit [Symbiobacteriaceae bacterium]|nr:efflux RND transporter periplasmic adaptor subunit [Symbiobacteriaceae bacterium]
MKGLFKKPRTVNDVLFYLVILAVIGGASWWGWNRYQSWQTVTGYTYITTTLRPTTIQDAISGSGNLTANDTAKISNAATGKIEEIMVRDGEYVSKDQPLYRLSNASVETNRQQALLDLATAQTTYDRLLLQNSSSAGQMHDAQLKIDQRQNALDAVQTSRTNLRLYAAEGGTITDVNVRVGDTLSANTALFGFYNQAKENEVEYQIRLQQAKATLDARAKDLEKLTVSVDFSGVVSDLSVKPGDTVLANDLLLTVQEPLRLANATSSDTILRLQQAELNLSNRTKELEYLQVTAPATGMLSGLNSKPGDNVTTASSLGTINDNRQVIVRVNVPQSFINGVALGNKASVMINNSARTYQGVVTDITPTGTLDSASYAITYPVEITIDNDGTLLAGMSALVDIASSDATFRAVNSLRGTLANDVTKMVQPKVSGEILELYAKNGDWVLEGQVIALLKNDSLDLSYRQAQEDLKKLMQDEFRAPAIGRVTSVQVSNGSTVTPGQVLVTLQSDAVEAAYASAKNEYEKLLRRETANTDIRNRTGGTLEAIYVAAGDTIVPGQLLAELSSNDIIYQEARALADLEQAKAELQALLLNTSAGELELARLRLEQAKLTLDNRNKQVEDLTIKALISGVVNLSPSRTWTVGDEFTDAGTIIGTIYDYSAFKLTINVDELEIPKIQIGSEVVVTVDAFPGKFYPARVTLISNEGTVANGGSTYPVTILFSTNDPVKAAMTSTATIVLQKSEQTLAVLSSAVTERRFGEAVSYIVRLLIDGEPVEREVQIGMKNVSMTELLAGVQAGDQVITGVMDNSSGELNIGGNATRGMGGNVGFVGGGPVSVIGPGGR